MVVLAIVAAQGLLVLARAPRSWEPSTAALAIGAGVLAVVLVESSYRPLFVDLPRDAGTVAVYEALDDLPPGVVTEAPPPEAARAPAIVQASRQLRSLIDGNPRVEGYSGTVPPDLREAQVAASNLPDPAAIAVLRSRGVRYVVLHVGSSEPFDPCDFAYAADEAAALGLALRRASGVVGVHEVADSEDLIVELAPADAAPAPAGPAPTTFGERAGACRGL